MWSSWEVFPLHIQSLAIGSDGESSHNNGQQLRMTKIVVSSLTFKVDMQKSLEVNHNKKIYLCDIL